jgi:hypothetical protein
MSRRLPALACALFCALFCWGAAGAAATPYFAAVGEPTIDRVDASSATLPDGRVLILGGLSEESSEPLPSVEGFSAQSNAFSPAGYISIGRQQQVSAALQDGRVLVAGGENSEGYALESAEIFNPATNNAVPTGSMLVSREYAAAASLPDGRVLIVGGEGTSGQYLASAEIYDPATGKFSSTGSMALGRSLPAAAPLGDGRVLVAGGINRTLPSDEGGVKWDLTDAELYDPATGTFSETGELLIGKRAAMAATLPDGRVLVAGGNEAAHNGESYEDAEIYDPATGQFSATVAMAHRRASAVAAALPDGRVLLAGGGGFEGFLRSAEAFYTDPLPASAGLDLGSQPLHAASSAKPLLVTNRGAQPLHVTGAASLVGPNAADFTIASDGCAGATVPNSQSCRVDLVFKPSAKGARAATLKLTDDAAGSPQSFTVTGTGVAGKPPKTKLGKHPPKKLKTKKPMAKATFKFSSPIPGATFACKLDKGKFKPCRSPKTYKLKPGPHRFQVKATAAGTTGKPASFAFKVVKAG